MDLRLHLHGSERKLTICKISKEASSSQHVNIKESDWVQDAFAVLEDLDDLLPPQRKTAATKADWFTNAMADFVPKKWRLLHLRRPRTFTNGLR